MTRHELVLAEIRKTHDTTKMHMDEFQELCSAIMFYIRGNHTIEEVARLASEELFPLVR